MDGGQPSKVSLKLTGAMGLKKKKKFKKTFKLSTATSHIELRTIQTPKSDQSLSTGTRSGLRGHSDLRPVTP